MASSLPRARGRSAAGLTHLTRARGRSAPQGFTHLTRARGKQVGAVVVEAGLGQTLEPFQRAQLTAVSRTSGVIVTSWKWELVSSTNPKVATVAITSNVNAASYITPATLTGTTLTFRVTATANGQTSTSTVAHIIRAHGGFWQARGGKYVPVNLTSPFESTADTGAGVYADVYDDTY